MSTPRTPGQEAATLLSNPLAASECQVRKAHLVNLKIALMDIEEIPTGLVGLAELLNALAAPDDGEIPTLALRVLVNPLRDHAGLLYRAFGMANAAFAGLSNDGAGA